MGVSNPFEPAGALPSADVTACRACSRLVEWREKQAETAPARYQAYSREVGYWARPVPAFGDGTGWLAIVGLAPAAHGANRTGRMFTGDRSGDFLFAALYRAGLATSPLSVDRDDGLRLRGVLVTAAVRCAPPGNRPTGSEADRCRPFLAAELAGMSALRVVLALGRFAHDALLRLLSLPGHRPTFGHGREHRLPGGVWLVDSYHVSQQNTFTGRLTEAMFDGVVRRCVELGRRAEAQ